MVGANPGDWDTGTAEIKDTFSVMPPKLPKAFIAIDTETGGLDCSQHGLLQIGAVASKENGEIIGTFVTDVRPGTERYTLTDEALAVNLFSRLRIEAAPSEGLALSLLKGFLAGFAVNYEIVAVFKNAHFDLGFLDDACRRSGVSLKSYFRRVRDVDSLAPLLWGERDYPRSLDSISKKLGLDMSFPHDAMYDALRTIKAFHLISADLRRPRRGPAFSLTDTEN